MTRCDAIWFVDSADWKAGVLIQLSSQTGIWKLDMVCNDYKEKVIDTVFLYTREKSRYRYTISDSFVLFDIMPNPYLKKPNN